MAHICILTLVFPPDSNSTAHIVGNVAKELSAAGHKISVITTMPHNNAVGCAAEPQGYTERKWGGLLTIREYHGIRSYHTYMPRKSPRLIMRLAAFLGFHLLATLVGMTRIRGIDLIITPSPPLTIGVCAWILAKMHRCEYIYNVQEIYPDLAVNLGAIRNRALIYCLTFVERFVYRKARIVTVIAPRMAERLVNKGVPSHKVMVIPNFSDGLRPLPNLGDNKFRAQHGLQGKFVVLYAGNFGRAQGLETLLEAAAFLKCDAELIFVLVGDGTERKRLVEQTSRMGLTNVIFVEYQPPGLMGEIYSAADICVVPLRERVSFDAIPSKVYEIMACGRPVLAVANRGSDLAELIEKARCGFVVAPGSPRAQADAILEAKNEWRAVRLSRMGDAGSAYVRDKYTLAETVAKYHELLERLELENRQLVDRSVERL